MQGSPRMAGSEGNAGVPPGRGETSWHETVPGRLFYRLSLKGP